MLMREVDVKMDLGNKSLEKLDKIVSIKMAHDFDSLNVSAAGAILMDRMK